MIPIKQNQELSNEDEKKRCGIVMPISHHPDYSPNHWKSVLDILFEAINETEFSPNLVSNEVEIGVIHDRIWSNLFNNEMIVCDLSSINPNVMFELGIRLAFDKPVIIIKDDKTRYLFDTGNIEHLNYPSTLEYHEIVHFKQELIKRINATYNKFIKEKNFSPYLKDLNKSIKRIDIPSSLSSNDINDKISETHGNIVGLKEKFDIIEIGLINHVKLIDIIQGQQTRVRALLNYIKNSSIFLTKFYLKVLEEYLKDFRIIQNGFYIGNEFLSLMFYVSFWEFLLGVQIENSKDKNMKPLIIRAVHSTNINVWVGDSEKYKEYSYALFKYQREFIERGGKIVRIFLGREINPNSTYMKAMDIMQKNLVEVKYVSVNPSLILNFDYLMIYEERVSLRWYSDAIGDGIAGSLMQDKIEEEIVENWKLLCKKLSENGNPIIAIPEL